MLASRRAPKLGAPTDSVLLEITTAPIYLDSAQVLGKATSTVRALVRALVRAWVGILVLGRALPGRGPGSIGCGTLQVPSTSYTGGDSMMTAGEKRNACGGLKLSCHNITPERAKSTKWSWHES